MRIKSDTAYKQLKATYQNKETIVGEFVIKKLGNSYCIYHGEFHRLVVTLSSTYIATDKKASPETIQQAFDTFSIQCDREKDTAPIDFTRKFTLIKIDATGKNEAPHLSNFRLSPSELSKVRQSLSRHVEHLKSDKVDIYFRKTRYSSNYYEIHINVNGGIKTINGIDRQVTTCLTRPIEQEEFSNTTFSSLTELLAFVGIGVQYLD